MPTCMLPEKPERAFDIPCATSSLSTSTLSSPVEILKAGTLIGTCNMPKNVRANMAGIVSARADQLTAEKSSQN